MSLYPASFEKLTDQLRRLPGVGAKSAQRMAFWLLSLSDSEAEAFADAIVEAKHSLRRCSVCQNLSDQEVCGICASMKRDKSKICVVSEPRDVIALERSREYDGVYHVLHGVISPLRHVGPDDLTVKELLARIHAVLRRTGGEEEHKGQILSFDKLEINMDSYELIVDGKKIDTPPKEMALLYHLASSPNRVYTRNQLLDEVWGFDYLGDSRTVDVHIKRLREKLEGVSPRWALSTVWGVGYKFETFPEK